MAPADNAELNTDTNTAVTAATSSEDNAGSSNEVTTYTDDNANALEVDSTTDDKTDVDAKTEDKAESESEDKTTESTDDEEDDLTDDEAGKLDSKVKAKLSKKNREAANLRDRLGKESLRADRAEVALAIGLDADAATLLAGDTREAIEESAEKLLVLLGHKERVTPAGLPKEKSGKQHVSAPDSEVSLDDIGARMFKR